MRRTGLLITLFFLLAGASYAQESELFIYREFKNAVNKGTRTLDGVPGRNYWTNTANYKIKASLEPVTRLIKGSGAIEYFNNSPDSLKSLVINLYPDLYAKGAARNIRIDPTDAGDGMVIKQLKINGTEFPLAKMQPGKAVGVLRLPQPLPTKQKLDIEVTWEFTMPKFPDSRIGTYGDSSLFVAYWYPQVGVYDDVFGWDVIGYEGEHEFYTDNGNFDIELTVPNGILVWATGTLTNGSDIYTSDYLKKIDAAFASSQPVIVCEPAEISKALKPGKEHTWKFSAKNVPDASFCVSNKMRWEAVGLPLENGARKVLINSVYTPGTDSLTPEVAGLSRHIIKYFSEVFPGVPYPYEHMTVYNGSGGMEFPMMVNQDTENDRWLATYVTTHEIAHTYFPFLTGTNEKRASWLDEGMAVYLPLKEQTRLFAGLKYDEVSANVLSRSLGLQSDVPLINPSYFATGGPHMMGAYGKSSMAFLIVEEMIGFEKMRAALQDFIKTWKYKHPTQYDFFFTVNRVAGENLNWFWNPWFFDHGYPDLAVKDAGTKSNRKVEVVMSGNMPVPVDLEVTFTDGSKERITRNASVWKNGKKSVILEVPGSKEVKSVKLGSPKIPDVDLNNNTLSF